jgi:3',5'-cyclic AMP phosphodiesterase CpdA
LTTPIRLAHFSDIHVTHFPLSASFAVKRLAAVASYSLAGRGKHFEDSDLRIEKLLGDIDSLDIDHAICTGDLTGVSGQREFERVAQLFGPRRFDAQRFTVIPGNHDRYVSGAKHDFEKYFGRVCGTFPFVKSIAPGVSLVCIDVTRPTSLVDSSGLVGVKQRAQLRALLCDSSLRHQFVILALHYGLLRAGGVRDARHHGLRDDLEFMELIDAPDVHLDLVIHGHMHRPYVVKTKRRTVVNAGSATDLHVKDAGYNIYEINIEKRSVQISRRVWRIETNRYIQLTESPMNQTLELLT